MTQDSIQQLILTQLVKSVPFSLWKPENHYPFHKIPPLNHILSQPNPIRLIRPYLPKVYFNVILKCTPKPSKRSLTFVTHKPKPSKHLFPAPRVLHVPPTSSSSI